MSLLAASVVVVAALAADAPDAPATDTQAAPSHEAAPAPSPSPTPATSPATSPATTGEPTGDAVKSEPASDAQPPPVPEVRERVPGPPPRTYAMLRGGLSNDPTILQACAEVIPIDGVVTVRGAAWHTGLSVEGCGNGSGFLFRSPAPEIAHFRAKWKLWAFDTAWGWFEPIAAVGFAELQTGGDVPGFSFSGPDAGGNATAGPEAGTSLRYKLPLALGFELLAEAGISVAYFAYARELNTPADPYQTSLALSAGVGW